jgi:N-methylhydantoinase A
MGLLQTDVKHYYLQSRLGSLAKASVDELNPIFVELEARAKSEAEREGFDPTSIRLQRQLDLRYPFQGYELTIDVPNRPMVEADKAKIRADFDARHKEVYGTHASGEVPDIVNVRVMSIAEVAKLDLPELKPQQGEPKPVGRRKVLFDEAAGYVDTPIYDRAALGAGAEIAGPAIIEQLDSTTVIMPGQTSRVERYGNIIIEIG